MQFEDFIRLASGTAAALTFVFFAIRINDDWEGMSSGWKTVRLAVLGLVGTAAYGLVEIMLVDPPVPLGLRNAFVPFFILALSVGLFMVRRETNPMSGKWIAVEEVERILADIEAEEFGHHACTSPVCIKARTRLALVIAHAKHDRGGVRGRGHMM